MVVTNHQAGNDSKETSAFVWFVALALTPAPAQLPVVPVAPVSPPLC